MSDTDHKTATHLDPDDLLSLVRLGKLQADLRLLNSQAAPLVERANGIVKKLSAKYGLDMSQGDGADDETGEIRRVPRPAKEDAK